MPKQKTNRAAAKRYKLNGAGNVVRGKSGLRHGMINKSRGRKRKLGTAVLVADVDRPKVLRQLGKR